MGKPVGFKFLEDGEVNDTGIAEPWTGRAVFQAMGSTTAGAGTATVIISGSTDGVTYDQLAEFTLAWTNPALGSDSFALDASWPFVKAEVTAITGTNAKVQVYIGA